MAGAARLAAYETNKLNAKLSDGKRKAEEAATSSAALAASFHKLKMDTDNAYAGMVRYNKAAVLVNKIAIEQKYSQEQLGAELQRLATHYGVAEAAGMKVGGSMKSAGFHTANLGAQFNDIGVMLAAGQNPLMLAIQQGTQISQVLQAAGGTAKETGKLLLASFKSIISPISLATIGIIAAGAALFQWATSASDAGVAVDEAKEATEGYSASLDTLEGDLSSASGMHEAYVAAFKTGSKDILTALAAEAKARQAITALDFLDAQDAQKAASGKAEAQKLVVAGLAAELAMQEKLVASTAANAASVSATVPGGRGGAVASPEAVAARLVAIEYERQNKELQAQQDILARNTAEFDVLDAQLGSITVKMAATKDILSTIAGGLPPIVDGFAVINDSSAATAIAEQKQADLTRLRINYFHQLAGEYAAVNTTALSMVDAAAKIAAEEQRQADLARLKKDYFHLLAGETSAVSTFLAASASSAQDLADVDINSGIAMAASSAATLAKNMGITLDSARKLLAAGYAAPGAVVRDPRAAGYDPAAVARADAALKATQLRTEFSTPAAATAASTVGTSAGAANPVEAELEQLQNSLKSQEQLELESYQRRQEMLDTALAQKLLTQQEYAGLIEQSEAQHNFAMLQATNAGVSSTLNSLGKLFEGSKQVSAGIALANSYLAFTEVLKDPSFANRPFARFAAAAAALSSGLAAVRSIKSAQPGGGGGGGVGTGGSSGGGATGGAATTSTQVSLQLVGGDLYSRDQVLQLINAINSATADGAQILLR
jgi:hypothetical protein